MKGKTVLVTGGLGYIGSHTTVELISEGFTVIIVDNLSNSEKFILDRIEQISGTRPLFYENDYDTPDGSCLRDYIHVVDLAKAHVQACKRLIENRQESSFKVFNIGTGKGTSVLEMIATFEKITQQKLNYIIGLRREGDAAAVYADTAKANAALEWKAQLDLDDMIASSWKWEKNL